MAQTRLPRGIRLRGEKFFVDVTVDGVRRTATCPTLDAALLKRAEIEADVRGGRVQGGEVGFTSWTLETAYKHCCEHCWAGTKAESSSTHNARSSVAYFGASTRLEQITTLELDRYTASLKRQGAAPGTINRKLAALSKMMTEAHKRGKLAAKPSFPRQAETRRRIRWLTDEEERIMLGLLRQWEMHEEADILAIFLDTGFRMSELWRLKGDSINELTNQINLWTTKTDTPRAVVMTSRVKVVMLARLREYGWGLLFPAWNNHRWRRVYERLAKPMGLQDDDGFIPYVSRHTCCTRLVRRGVPFRLVMSWMGHKSMATTLRYSQLAPGDMGTLASVLEAGEGTAWKPLASDRAIG